MWFIDNTGQLQLTGGGFLLLLFMLMVTILFIYDCLKKIFFHLANYKRLLEKEKELLEAEEWLEKNIRLSTEKYYAERKRWEKMNGYW